MLHVMQHGAATFKINYRKSQMQTERKLPHITNTGAIHQLVLLKSKLVQHSSSIHIVQSGTLHS